MMHILFGRIKPVTAKQPRFYLWLHFGRYLSCAAPIGVPSPAVRRRPGHDHQRVRASPCRGHGGGADFGVLDMRRPAGAARPGASHRAPDGLRHLVHRDRRDGAHRDRCRREHRGLRESFLPSSPFPSWSSQSPRPTQAFSRSRTTSRSTARDGGAFSPFRPGHATSPCARRGCPGRPRV